jgi:hypothetical protein
VYCGKWPRPEKNTSISHQLHCPNTRSEVMDCHTIGKPNPSSGRGRDSENGDIVISQVSDGIMRALKK